MRFFQAISSGIVSIFLCLNLYSQVHTSYLWHLEQPVYWPETSIWNPFEYQKAWESQYLKWNNGNWYSDGQQHPLNNIQEIFGNDDRKAVYQFRTKDAVQSLTGLPEAGAQVSYSGCLMENVKSLADAGQWGYYSGWENSFITARGWTTSAGASRMDMVGFSMNHVLSPLVSEKMLRRQIQAHRFLYNERFGTSPNYSKGYWPAECSFSERIIKALVEEGFEWSVIANSHLARTLADYPLQFGTSGCNIDPPNQADKVSTNGLHWWSGQIDGRGGTFAAPYCYQAHKAKYVDPNTGTEYKITVVPMDDLLSYRNGYSLMGTGDIDNYIAPYNDPSQPSMVMLAHDGDNAWGGGYDYYTHSVPDFANEAASKGYVPTTVQQFLNQHQVPLTDVVHVEDGSWFNAANDWGHPQFINWLWPMYTSGYDFDPNGWTEDARNWAVLVAAENRVQMSEDLHGTLNIGRIVHPSSASNAAERAWHYLLPAYNSGYMYYGTSIDMEVKQTLACNKACDFANQVISANPNTDNTAPTVFIPQRYPYNPGGIGFGPNYGYQQHQNSSDFYVWTFAYDVSGIQSATLKYRLDNDGSNPIGNNENETYAGGSGVQAWQSVNMNYRNFPTGNVSNNPEINFFILPDYIAGEYYGQISGIAESLVDYYVEMTDGYGNITKSPIQHVYVGTTNSGSQTGVSWFPQNPTRDDIITITEHGVANSANLHWGVRVNSTNWQTPVGGYWPAGSNLFNGTGPAIETPMSGPGTENTNTLQIGPFNNSAQAIKAVNFVMHYSNNTWNNNNGSDFYIPILNPPSVTTLAASSISSSTAILNGSINSNNLLTSYYFQWGLTNSYGNSTPSLSLPAGSTLTMVNVTITGLTAGSTIHYRLVASNVDGTTLGQDLEFTASCGTISSFPWTEDFENNSSIPECWLEEQMNTSGLGWSYLGGNGGVNPPSAFQGNFNACLKDNTTEDTKARLISPAFNLTALNNPTLSFRHFQEAKGSGQDELKVYYRNSGVGNWTELQTFSTQVNTWTEQVISLPTPSAEYFLAFEGNAKDGHGTCLDEISVHAAVVPYLSALPLIQSVPVPAGSTTFSVNANVPWTASSDQPWCVVTLSGNGNGTIVATYSENHSASARVAHIVLQSPGLMDVSLSVIQDASTNEFNFYMANDLQISERIMEFDLLVVNLNSSVPFELGSIQAGITLNPSILNGGTLVASIIGGSSTLNLAQQPTSVGFTQSQNCIKLASKAPPGAGNGTLISNDPGAPTRVCRLRLTNTLAFGQAHPDLTFGFSTIPYPTKVSKYIAGINTALPTNASNCYNACSNGLLNPPPFLDVSPLNQTATSSAGSLTFNVSSNSGWTAISDQSWCSLSSASGFGSGTISASFSDNGSSEDRTASIVVTVSGLPPVTVTLTQNGAANRTIHLNLFLEGLYDGNGMMHPAMDESGAHWPEGTADRITVELRSGNNYNVLLYSISNVDLLTNGTAVVTVPSQYNQPCYLTVRHRNSIETVSAEPLLLTALSLDYSFNSDTKAYGNNMRLMPDGFWVLWGGDANQDGLVDASDMIMVDNDASSFATGYLDSDLNGDGLTDAGDMILLDNNASQFIAKITP